MADLKARRYHGEEDAVIAYGTDVWLRDAGGQDIDLSEWTESHGDELVRCRCGSWEIVDGAFAPVNGDIGIEMCDSAEIFESDFDAAKAIRDKVAPTASIWYYPSPKDGEFSD